MDPQAKDYGRLNISSESSNTTNSNGEAEAKQRAALIEWLNSILPNLCFPKNASDEELRASFIDGTILCRILNRLRPGSVTECGSSDHSSESHSENVKRFLAAMDEMALPRFQIVDLEKGSMKIVLECLLALKVQFMPNDGGYNLPKTSSAKKSGSDASMRWKLLVDHLGDRDDGSPREESPRTYASILSGEERPKGVSVSKFQRTLRSPIMTEPSGALIHHVGHKFHEVFQMKPGCYADLPAAKISEMMKSNSLDNAPTQSLLSVVNGILEESVERKNSEIPHRVACLLRKVVQEIERRIATQAEHLRTQSNLFKAREEKYQSRIRVLEVLATGTSEETQIVMNQLQQMKVLSRGSYGMFEKTKMEGKKEVEEQDVERSMKQKDHNNHEIAALKQELEIAKKTYEKRCLQMETEAKGDQQELEKRLKEVGLLLTDSRNRIKELEFERTKMEEKKEIEEQDGERLMKQKNHNNHEIAALKQELEMTRKTYEQRCLQKETEAKGDQQELEKRLKEVGLLLTESRNRIKDLESEKIKLEEKNKVEEQDVERLMKQKDHNNHEISALKQELELARRTYEHRCLQMETESKGVQQELEGRLKEVGFLLTESRNRIKELEAKCQRWNKKEHIYQIFAEVQLGGLRELGFASQSIRQEMIRTQKSYLEEFNLLGKKTKALEHAAENYHSVLSENRKLHNEVQELKGNIRVYCRIRPFLPGQKGNQSIIEYIGDNGELIVANPSKQGKEGRRSFKFNKVYGPAATQAEVFSDTQPLVQSVLDGYNVCIFAYGQTGSGKTYTMTGPDGASEEDWGVNYRALNDLFQISQTRESTFTYEVGVQMVEIYNEQVRDLLSSDGSQKRLGILTTSQPSGLAVPDASMHPVNLTSDVMVLMETGLKNRAKGATALNERSSRSHSVVTIHVRGMDLKTGASLRGSLHLVDLAGSERVDRSEVTGDRLKEAQHINKSLSALGDVIFSLAQKSSHVPYRNSKLTQVLQSSLGGQAKTLMFVQLNPDVDSFSESLSTLKFAERVSGIELGAARSSKEGRDVRELMEQVTSLKDTVAKKDEEIERLQLLKDPKIVHGEKRGTTSVRHGSISPIRKSKGGTPSRSLKLSGRKGSDQDNCSENSDKHSAASSHQSNSAGQNFSADSEILGFGDAEHEERLSDISDGGLSMGTDTDGSVENNLLPEVAKPPEISDKPKSASRVPRPPLKSVRDATKVSEGLRKSTSASSISTRSSKRWQ